MYDSFPLQRTSGLLILIFLMRQLDLSRPLILFTKLTEGGSLTGSCLFHEFTRTTGSPSSSCEMIILQNKSHGENIRVCMKIFTTALKNCQILNKNTSPYFHNASLLVWPLIILKGSHFSELSISMFTTPERRTRLHTPFPNARSERQ